MAVEQVAQIAEHTLCTFQPRKYESACISTKPFVIPVNSDADEISNCLRCFRSAACAL